MYSSLLGIWGHSSYYTVLASRVFVPYALCCVVHVVVASPAGHIVVSSLVRDQTREEMYWLTTDGRLCGIVPCLGHEPHSFLALTQTDSGELMPHEGGEEADILLYFNDGQGAICCVKLVS